jgi:hypothetical protein
MDGGADAFPPMPARRRPEQVHDAGARTKGDAPLVLRRCSSVPSIEYGRGACAEPAVSPYPVSGALGNVPFLWIPLFVEKR